LVELEPDFGKQVKFSEFIGYYGHLEVAEEKEFRETYVECSPFRENIVNIWKEQGEATGAIRVITSLYEAKKLSAADARAQLKLVAEQGVASKDLVAEALRKIGK
jgi:hypothetical protein